MLENALALIVPEECTSPATSSLAVGVVVDRTFVETQDLYVDVETKGEKTRGETVAARKGYSMEFRESQGTRTVVGRKELTPNAKVCVEVDKERFLNFFAQRVLGVKR